MVVLGSSLAFESLWDWQSQVIPFHLKYQLLCFQHFVIVFHNFLLKQETDLAILEQFF